jgi:hypothetical protein
MQLASASVEALNALDPRSLLSALGALGVFLILFAETGLLIGSSCPATRCCSPPGCCAPPAPRPRCTCRCPPSCSPPQRAR